MLGFIVILAFLVPHLLWILPLVNQKKWVSGLVFSIVFDISLVFVLFSLRVWTSVLWFEQLGFLPRFWTQFGAEISMLLIGASIAFVLTFINVWIVRMTAPRNKSGNFLNFGAFIGVLIASGLISLIFGLLLSGSWDTYLKFSNSVSFNKLDPVFGKDLSFYIFTLPWVSVVRNFLMFLCILQAAVISILYYAMHVEPFESEYNDTSELKKKRHEGAMRWVTHLSVIAFLFAAVSLLGVKISMWDLVFSTRGAVFGAGYTDVNVQLFWYKFMFGFLFFLMVAFLVAIFARSLKATVWTFGLGVVFWFFAYIVLVLVVPAMYQHYEVSPNELTLEKPYIMRNIEFTRAAYGLDKIQVVDFPVNEEVTPEMVRENQSTLDNIRLWDWRVLQANNDQRQTFRLYYHFPDVDVVRYEFGGKIYQMMSSCRELDQERLDSKAKTWQNQRLVYTHGYGMCMNPVNVMAQDGQPDYWVKNIPPVSKVPELAITQPEIYFGEATKEHIFVKTKHLEFDYPYGDTNVTCFYEGNGGVVLGSGLRKLAFALRFDGLRMFMSDELTPESRIIFNRDLGTRVRELAPFLAYDDDPYQIIADGRIWFIWDAYTYTGQYPYSERYSSRDYGDVNYLRNSVKVVMDAYNGDVFFYVYDSEDPIIKVWQKIFPDMFLGKEQMPPYFRQHMRYPEDLMHTQAMLYRVYHMDDPGVFYNREDAWDIAQETYSGNHQAVLPYFVTLTLPGEETEEFVQVLPFTPRTTDENNPKNNMLAWIAARCDGENYGKLIVYRFPKEKLILGPMQVEIRINQDERISADFTLWGQKGSTVIQANLITIPLAGYSMLYVEPIYLQADLGKMPEMKRVVVASNSGLGYGASFEAALQDLLGQKSELDFSDGSEGEIDAHQLVQMAGQYFRDYQELTSEGKFSEAGEKLEALERVLIQLLEK